MTLIDWFILILASGQIVDTWINGSIFERIQNYYRREREATDLPRPGNRDRLWVEWRVHIFSDLMTCPYCLTHHAVWVLLVLFFVPTWGEPGHGWRIPLWILAAIRVNLIIDGVLPAHLRYDRTKVLLHDVDLSEFRLTTDPDHVVDTRPRHWHDGDRDDSGEAAGSPGADS